MAGDDPNSSGRGNKDSEDPYYGIFDENDPLFNEEYLESIMVDPPTPNLMDFDFTDINQNPPLLPPPPPPPPLALPPIPQDATNINAGNEYDFIFDSQHAIALDMFGPSEDLTNNNDVLGEIGNDVTSNGVEPSNEDINRNNNNVQGEIGNDNENVVDIVGENAILELTNRVFGENRLNFETGGPSVIPVTPTMSPGTIVCRCSCHLLRSLVHNNDQEIMRLDIHGGVGYFCHAILEIQRYDGGSTESQYHTFHLKVLNMEDVMKFIQEYCKQREEPGFRLVKDTDDASVYQSMNACVIGNQPLSLTLPPQNNVPLSLAMPNEVLNIPPVPLYVPLRDEPAQPRKAKERKQTPLAIQRERTKQLTLKDLKECFCLPIEEAARKMSLCPTVVKKICRRGGLPRWPHRKIRSLHRKIDTLKSLLRHAKDPQVRAKAEREVEIYQNEIEEICAAIIKNCED